MQVRYTFYFFVSYLSCTPKYYRFSVLLYENLMHIVGITPVVTRIKLQNQK